MDSLKNYIFGMPKSQKIVSVVIILIVLVLIIYFSQIKESFGNIKKHSRKFLTNTGFVVNSQKQTKPEQMEGYNGDSMHDRMSGYSGDGKISDKSFDLNYESGIVPDDMNMEAFLSKDVLDAHQKNTEHFNKNKKLDEYLLSDTVRNSNFVGLRANKSVPITNTGINGPMTVQSGYNDDEIIALNMEDRNGLSLG